jgi:hypothetical protein
LIFLITVHFKSNSAAMSNKSASEKSSQDGGGGNCGVGGERARVAPFTFRPSPEGIKTLILLSSSSVYTQSHQSPYVYTTKLEPIKTSSSGQSAFQTDDHPQMFNILSSSGTSADAEILQASAEPHVVESVVTSAKARKVVTGGYSEM